MVFYCVLLIAGAQDRMSVSDLVLMGTCFGALMWFFTNLLFEGGVLRNVVERRGITGRPKERSDNKK